MILKHSNLNLFDKEPYVLLIVLVEARKEKALEFNDTLNPDVLEELQLIQRLIKKVYKLVVGEKTIPSANRIKIVTSSHQASSIEHQFFYPHPTLSQSSVS